MIIFRKKTDNLESQITSMRYILENLAKNYDDDRAKQSLLFQNGHSVRSQSDASSEMDEDEEEEEEDQSDTAVVYDGGHSLDDEQVMDLYDERNRNNSDAAQIQRNQHIDNEIMHSSPSCWSKIFYCGGDNDQNIQRDIDLDKNNKNERRRTSNKNRNTRYRQDYDSYDSQQRRPNSINKKMKKQKKKRVRVDSAYSYDSKYDEEEK